MNDRLPPHSIEAEFGAMGCALLDPSECAATLVAKTTPEHFYDLRCRIVFDALSAMSEAGKPIDTITVSQWIKVSGKQGADLAFVSSMVDSVPSAANLQYWIDILEDRFYRRSVIKAAYELTEKAYVMTSKLEELANTVESDILALRSTGKKEGTRAESFGRIIAKIEDGMSRKAPDGIMTGYPDIDRYIRGLRPGKLLVLAARPSVGKSSLALNIGENVAKQGIPVGIFSLEMDEDELNTRSLATESGVNMNEAMSGGIDERDFPKLAHAMSKLSNLPIHIDDASDLKINQIRAKARRWVKNGIRFIIVDYLQLVDGDGFNRADIVAKISGGCKKMAKELGIPVLALAQLNREIEKDNGPDAKGKPKKSRRPRMSDLRESGSIEQDADTLMFLYAEDESNEHEGRLPVKVLFAKNRGGPKGEIEMLFNKPLTRFESISRL